MKKIINILRKPDSYENVISFLPKRVFLIRLHTYVQCTIELGVLKRMKNTKLSID